MADTCLTISEWCWQVRKLHCLGENAKAAQLLTNAMKSPLEDAERIAVARCLELEYAKRYAEALEQLDRTRQTLLPTQASRYWFLRGVLHYYLNHTDESLRCYRLALMHPAELDLRAVRYNIALAHENQGSYDAATRMFQRALDESGYLNDGDIHYAIGQVQERIQKAVKKQVPLPITWRGRIMRYDDPLWGQLIEEAMAAYRAALAAPGFARGRRAWYRLGLLYRSARKNSDAISCFSKVCSPELIAALSTIPDNPHHPVLFPAVLAPLIDTEQEQVAEACFYLTELYRSEGHWHKALALYTALVQSDPTRVTIAVWPALRDLCKHMPCSETLLRQYRELARQSFAQLYTAEWQLAGMLLAEHEEYELALAYYARVLADATWPLPGLAWHSRGDAYAEMNQYPLAIACYLRALCDRRYHEAQPELWNNLAIAYQACDEQEKAKRCVRHLQEKVGWTPLNSA